MGGLLQRGNLPKEQRRAVVVVDYPELGDYTPTPGLETLLDAAAASIATNFHGLIIDDYFEN